MPARVAPTLNVTDLPRALDWYKALGFKVKSASRKGGAPTFAELDYDGAALWLVDAALAGDDEAFRAWMSTPLGAGVMLNYEVRDLDAAWRRAERMGATVEMELAEHPEGRMFMLNDPDGYVVGFWTAAKARKPAKKAATKRATKRPAKKAAKKRVARRR